MRKSKPATVSKEAERSLQEQRARYESQLGVLQEQQTAAQQSFATQLDTVNRMYEQRQGSLQSQLDEQRNYYETLLGTLNKNLEEQKSAAEAQKTEYERMSAAQQEQVGILSAERDRAAALKTQEEEDMQNSSLVYQNSLMNAVNAARRLRSVRATVNPSQQSSLLR